MATPVQTMPLSAGFETQLWFDRTFVQRSVRLDIGKLEAQCAHTATATYSMNRFALRSARFPTSWSGSGGVRWPTCGAGEDGVLPLKELRRIPSTNTC